MLHAIPRPACLALLAASLSCYRAVTPHGAHPQCGPGYVGFVEAKITQGTTPRFSAYADFAAGDPIDVACPNSPATVGGCCCVIGTPHPLSSPDASTITLATNTSHASLSTLTATLGFYGTSDLGPAWYFRPGAYTYAGSSAWMPGEELHVSASGGAVHGFEGTLRTGPMLAGVTPAFQSTTITIDRASDFVVTWMPAGGSDDDVVLIVRQITMSGVNACFCTAPDGAGSITLGRTRLASFGAQQLSTTVQLIRRSTETVCGDNATVALVGTVEENGDATFE